MIRRGNNHGVEGGNSESLFKIHITGTLRAIGRLDPGPRLLTVLPIRVANADNLAVFQTQKVAEEP